MTDSFLICILFNDYGQWIQLHIRIIFQDEGRHVIRRRLQSKHRRAIRAILSSGESSEDLLCISVDRFVISSSAIGSGSRLRRETPQGSEIILARLIDGAISRHDPIRLRNIDIRSVRAALLR